MNWLRKLMYGRYGVDQLSLFLALVYFVLYLLANLLRWKPLLWLAPLPLLLAMLRFFSRNLEKRRAENAGFLALVSPALVWFRLHRTKYKDKEHCYFRCPNCGQQLRVPRGKGKITVTCRNCGVSFEEKS